MKAFQGLIPARWFLSPKIHLVLMVMFEAAPGLPAAHRACSRHATALPAAWPLGAASVLREEGVSTGMFSAGSGQSWDITGWWWLDNKAPAACEG